MTTRKEIDEKNVEAIVKAGQVYPLEFFKNKGKSGGKIGGKKQWAKKTAKQKKAHIETMNKARLAKKK